MCSSDLYSLFMLPTDKNRRLGIYHRILDNNCALHMALEGMLIETNDDISRIEDILAVSEIMHEVGQIPNILK